MQDDQLEYQRCVAHKGCLVDVECRDNESLVNMFSYIVIPTFILQYHEPQYNYAQSDVKKQTKM